MPKPKIMINLLLMVLLSCSCQTEPTPTDSPRAEAYETTVEHQAESRSVPQPSLDTRYTNLRYRFSIAYPDDWQVLESENQDGVTFTHPTDPAVLCRAYGSDPLDEFFTPAEIAKIEDSNERFDNYQELSDKNFSVRSGNDETGSPLQANLRTISYTQDGIPYQMLQWTAQLPDRKLSVECEAPAERYEQYAELFGEITKSLQILKNNE